LIQVQYTLTVNDARDLCRNMRLRPQFPFILHIGGWLVTLLSSSFLFLFVSPFWLLLLFFPAAWSILVVRMFVTLRRPSLPALELQLPRDLEQAITIDSDVVTSTTKHSKGVMRWAAFAANASYECRTHFVLAGQSVALTLPKRALSETQQQELRGLMHRLIA
jgi:hypothetical protein